MCFIFFQKNKSKKKEKYWTYNMILARAEEKAEKQKYWIHNVF